MDRHEQLATRQIRNLMHKVSIRVGDEETVVFVAAESCRQAKELAFDVAHMRWDNAASVSAQPVVWGEGYRAYTLNIKTGIIK